MRVAAFVALIVLTVGCRAAYVIPIRLAQAQRPDRGAEVELAAVSLLEHGVLGNVYHHPTGPTAHVSPLWPLVMAAIFAVIGPYTLAAMLVESFLAMVLTAANLACLPWLARRTRWPESAGWIAAFTLAILPINFIYESHGDWEQPLAALVLTGLVACFLELHEAGWQRPWLVGTAGVLSGIAALLSPSLLPAIALMIVVEFAWASGPRRRVLGGAAVICAISLLLVAPWMLRNYYALGGFVPLRSNFGLELSFGNNPEATGSSNVDWSDPDMSNKMRHPHPNGAECRRLGEIGELAYMKQRQAEAVSWIRANPGRFLALTAARFRMFWFPGPEMFNSISVSTVTKMIAFGGISALMFFGLARRLWQRDWSALLLAAAILGTSLIYMITHVELRYRLPAHALSALVAADTVVWLAAWASVAYSRLAARAKNEHRRRAAADDLIGDSADKHAVEPAAAVRR
jgi:hypothetical protein